MRECVLKYCKSLVFAVSWSLLYGGVCIEIRIYGLTVVNECHSPMVGGGVCIEIETVIIVSCYNVTSLRGSVY